MIPTYSPPNQSSDNRPRINQTQRNQVNKKYVPKANQDSQKEYTDDAQDANVPNQDMNNSRGNRGGRGRNKNRGGKKYVQKNTNSQQHEEPVVNEELLRVEVRDADTNEQVVFLVSHKNLNESFPANEREKFENK